MGLNHIVCLSCVQGVMYGEIKFVWERFGHAVISNDVGHGDDSAELIYCLIEVKDCLF